MTNLRISPLYLIFLIYLYWELGEKHGSKWNYLRKIGDISTVFSTYSPPNNNSLTFAYTLSHPKTPPSKSTTFEKTLKKKKAKIPIFHCSSNAKLLIKSRHPLSQNLVKCLPKSKLFSYVPSSSYGTHPTLVSFSSTSSCSPPMASGSQSSSQCVTCQPVLSSATSPLCS